MQAYEKSFLARGIVVGQVLLTADDIVDRQRHLNSRNTLAETVGVRNDSHRQRKRHRRGGRNPLRRQRYAVRALVATLVEADVLVVLSDVDGLYESDPRRDKQARLLSTVAELTPELERAAGGAGSAFGTGGMATKLEAARIVTAAGIPMVLANGARANVLQDVLAGRRRSGTLFLPRPRTMPARKRWLAFHQRARGSVTVDEGAARALVERRRQLAAGGRLSTWTAPFKRGIWCGCWRRTARRWPGG